MDHLLTYIETNKQRYLDELTRFIAIPSVSTNKEDASVMQTCARFRRKVGMATLAWAN